VGAPRQFVQRGRGGPNESTRCGASRSGLAGLSEKTRSRSQRSSRSPDWALDSVPKMARFGVRSGSVASARLDGSPADSRFQPRGANGANGRAHLPCRRSRVRVPSSASRQTRSGGFFVAKDDGVSPQCVPERRGSSRSTSQFFGVIRVGRQHPVPPANRDDPAV